MRYKTYLFDLDGTLTDSCRGIINAAKYALDRLGEPYPEEAVFKKFLGPPLWESFEKYIGFSKEKSDEAVRIYREYYSVTGLFENDVYPGIPELLRELRDKGCRLGVATSKPETYAKRILERFGLEGYFESITGARLDGTLKEKADIIELCLERLRLTDDRSGVVMVGDRRHDILGAKTARSSSIGVLYGYGSREELEVCGADHIVSSPMEILDI